MDRKAWSELLFRLELFAGEVETLCEHLGEKRLKKWYDNQDVCLKLNISLRTLQTLRTSGKLPYTQINRKMFYRPQDVEAFIVQSNLKKEINEQPKE
jgi:hypothetical protein